MYKFIVVPLLFFSIVFSLSSSSWLTIWIGLELNLISFIFILMQEKTIMKTERSIKYFLIQAIGSLIFLLSININIIFYNEISSINALTPPLALIMKSGMAPLHSWTPPVVRKFPPLRLFIFLTVQKLVPIVIIFSSWFILCSWVSVINILVGRIGGIIQSSFYKILVFSSINNIGWIIISLINSFLLFLVFFLIYRLINYLVVKFISIKKIKWIIQVKLNRYPHKLILLSMIISLGGLPPFIGFIPKWIVIRRIFLFIPLLTFMGILLSIFTLFFYLKSAFRILVPVSLNPKSTINLTPPFNFFTLMIINCCSPLMFTLLT